MRILATLALLALLAGCAAPTGPAGATTPACDGVARPAEVAANHTVALLSTSKGCIVVELFDDLVPVTVANFRAYASESFFDSVLFHRVIENFMVQTGGMGADGQFKTATHPMIRNEARSSGLKNEAYTLSMARTQAADSATNQFFINHAANAFLDPSGNSAGYAVFGKVVQGKSVVDAIATVPVEEYAAGKHCQADSQPSCPVSDVVLQSVRLL